MEDNKGKDSASGNAAVRKFDEAAFDEAVSKPNGWSDVADPVAEIRRMRDGGAPGNAAALREALEKFLDLARRGLAFFTSYRYTEAENNELEDAFANAQSALAAPARNVDRFADADAAIDAVKSEFANVMLLDAKQLHAVCDWLFAHAALRWFANKHFTDEERRAKEGEAK